MYGISRYDLDVQPVPPFFLWSLRTFLLLAPSTMDYVKPIHNRRERKMVKKSRFYGQNHDEQVLLFFRKHWIVLLPTVAQGVFFLCILPIVFLVMPFLPFPFFTNIDGTHYESLLLIILSGLYTLGVHWVFLQLFDYFFDVVIVTNYRVVDVRRSVFLQDQYDVVDIVRLEDVQSKQQGMLQTFLKYGEVCLNEEHVTHSKHFTHVPHPSEYAAYINTVKLAYIQERRRLKSRVVVTGSKLVDEIYKNPMTEPIT